MGEHCLGNALGGVVEVRIGRKEVGGVLEKAVGEEVFAGVEHVGLGFFDYEVQVMDVEVVLIVALKKIGTLIKYKFLDGFQVRLVTKYHFVHLLGRHLHQHVHHFPHLPGAHHSHPHRKQLTQILEYFGTLNTTPPLPHLLPTKHLSLPLLPNQLLHVPESSHEFPVDLQESQLLCLYLIIWAGYIEKLK